MSIANIAEIILKKAGHDWHQDHIDELNSDLKSELSPLKRQKMQDMIQWHQEHLKCEEKIGEPPMEIKSSSDGVDVSDSGLTDLRTLNLPKILNGYLIISGNKLKNHIGSPEVVNGCFQSNHNPLESLEGTPRKVQDFHCNSCGLKDLIYGSEEADDYHVHDNELVSFKGISKKNK
jgi:hypothetical protein